MDQGAFDITPPALIVGVAFPSVVWTWRWVGGGGSPCQPSCFNNLFFTVIKKSVTFAYIYIIKMWRVCWYDFSQIFSLSLADRNKLKEKTWFRWCVGRDRKEATLIKGNKTCTSSSSVRPLWHSWVLPGLQPPEKGKLNFSASKLLHWAVLNVTSSYQRAHDDSWAAMETLQYLRRWTEGGGGAGRTKGRRERRVGKGKERMAGECRGCKDYS